MSCWLVAGFMVVTCYSRKLGGKSTNKMQFILNFYYFIKNANVFISLHVQTPLAAATKKIYATGVQVQKYC